MPTQTTATKSSRINLRLTPAQEEKLRYVAASSQTSLSDFVLASALDRADRALADQTEFTADDDAFDHLLEALDTPLPTARIRAVGRGVSSASRRWSKASSSAVNSVWSASARSARSKAEASTKSLSDVCEEAAT